MAASQDSLQQMTGTLAAATEGAREPMVPESAGVGDADEGFAAVTALFAAPLLPPAAFWRERVLLSIGSLAPGGAERQLASLAAGLVRRAKLQVDVLCWYVGGKHDFYKSILDQAEVSVWSLHWDPAAPHPDHVMRIHASLAKAGEWLPQEAIPDILAFAEEFLKRRPGVVHCFLDETNVKAGIAAAMVGVPAVILHGRSLAPEPSAPYATHWRQAYLLLAACPRVRLASVSQAAAADYARWLGLPKNRVSVVRNSFDGAATEPADPAEAAAWARMTGLQPGRPVVGTVIRFFEKKRPLLWVETAAAIAAERHDVQFLLVGEGPLLDEVRALAHQRGIADRLLLPGIERQVALALANIDLLLLTSRVEGFPNVLVEAQALGVPVVTTKAGGAPEALDHGRTGWVVDSSDPNVLAERVVWVLDHPAWRQQAARAGPKFVRKNFAPEDTVKATLRLYGLNRGLGRLLTLPWRA